MPYDTREELSKYGLHGLFYNGFDIQDEYTMRVTWDLYRKWEYVKEQISKASHGSPNIFYVNYLSASSGSFPYFVASGHSSSETSAPRLVTGLTTPLFLGYYPDFPRIGCWIGICSIVFEGTNILARDYIEQIRTRALIPIILKMAGSIVEPASMAAAMAASIVQAQQNVCSSDRRTVGMIMADFPGESLINSIINNNNFIRDFRAPQQANIQAPQDNSAAVLPEKLIVANAAMLVQMQQKAPILFRQVQKQFENS